jgi:hypothetical protein
MTEGGRTLEQARHSVAFHEAGHAVAAFGFGHRILDVSIMSAAGELVDGNAGCARTVKPVTSLADAEQRICVMLAGVACSMTAYATGALPRELFRTTGPDEDLFVELELSAPVDSSPAAAAIYDGWTTKQDTPDEDQARVLAEAWTSSPDEAASLLRWLRLRTASLVEDPQFQAHAGRIAAALLEYDTLSGSHVEELLTRWDHIEGKAS